MNDTNQHFVTQAYLDRFIHPSSGQAILFPYRKGGNRCKPRGTKKLGSAMNFYRQRDNGVLTDKLDEGRTYFETRLFASGKRTASALTKCVFEDDFSPSLEDKVVLCAAAAFLFCGSPVQIHNTAMDALLAHQGHAFNQLNTPRAKELYRQKFGEKADEELASDREMLLSGELFVDVGEENWKQLGFHSFQLIEPMIKRLLEMRLTIVDCDSQCTFLTSDNPAVRTYASLPQKKDDELWFPISYKRGLLWHHRSLGERHFAGRSECFAKNRRVIKYSYKFVYAPCPEDWIGAAVKNETFNPLRGHYGSLNDVLKHAKPVFGSDGKRLNGEIVDLVAAMNAGEVQDVVGI